MKKSVELSIIIVNWNSYKYLEKCLISLRKYATSIKKEIIVIDNNSEDGSAEKIKYNFPEVFLIDSKVNLGFPKANNIGFQIARGKYILALNPDTEIFENTLQKSMDFLDQHKEYGCVGVKTLKENGEIQYSCARKFPSLKGFIFQVLYMDKLTPNLKFWDTTDMLYWDHKDSRDVDILQGSYMMFPKKIYDKIGGFDERIPMFFEDNEFCLRIKENGFKIRYLSETNIKHYAGKSTFQANQFRIAKYRYDTTYLLIKEFINPFQSKLYILLLITILPLKLIFVPLYTFISYIRNRDYRLKIYFFETLFGFKWAFDKFLINLLKRRVRKEEK